MDEDFENAFPLDYGLPAKEKKRYAKAKQAFELGIWGHPLKLIKGVELTTKGDYRNEWASMKRDNRHLREKLRREGIIAEDCFCAEISPKNRLLHLHGFYRLREEMLAVELHGILSLYWEKIHGAPIVWVQDIYSLEGLMKYNVKHTLKNYASLEFGDMRLLKSKGWLPVGWRKVCGVLVKWALEHGAKWDYEIDEISDFVGDYIAFAWDIVKEYLWRWCNDEVIRLEFRECHVIIYGDKITEIERS